MIGLVVIFYAYLHDHLLISIPIYLYHIGFRVGIERMLWRSRMYYQGKCGLVS